MTEAFFKNQVMRLRRRFGDRNFDDEFVLLVWREVCTMSDESMMRLVDIMVGSRASNKAPLLTDFREARLKEEQNRFKTEAGAASRSLDWPIKEGLKKILHKDFGGAKTVNEAIQIQILKNQLKKADGVE